MMGYLYIYFIIKPLNDCLIDGVFILQWAAFSPLIHHMNCSFKKLILLGMCVCLFVYEYVHIYDILYNSIPFFFL